MGTQNSYRMRILLRNLETNLYFVRSDEWTLDPARALNFDHVDRAAEAYTKEGIAYAEIVLVAENCIELPRPSIPSLSQSAFQ